MFATAGIFCALALLAACSNTNNNDNAGTGQESTAAAELDRSAYSITVMTGPTSGVYYPVGGAFAEVLTEAGYNATAQESSGSSENIQAIMGQEGDIAIAMADAAVQAYTATEAFSQTVPATDLRSLMGLWPNVCQIVTTADSGIVTFADLRGKRVGVGALGSGVEANARTMFAAHDMTYEEAEISYVDYGEAIEAIKVGDMDAAFVTSGLGNATIKELGETKPLAFVPVEGEAAAKLTADFPYYVTTTIPADVYGTAQDTPSVAVMNILIADQGLPNEVVTDILELFYSEHGLQVIGDSHPTAEENIRLDTGLRGVTGIEVPIHPAAEKFFADKGVVAP